MFEVEVLKRQKNIDVAVNDFRWTKQQNNFKHNPKYYEALLLILAKNRETNML